MSEQTSGYLSVLSYNLLHPIVTLWEELLAKRPKGPGIVQASTYENGYSTAICTLLAVFIESLFARTKSIMLLREANHKGLKSRSPEFFEDICTDSKLVAHVREVFVLRDVIVHNHIWDCDIVDTPGGMDFSNAPTLVDLSFGDRKYQETIDSDTRRSKKLDLNLFPTRVCADDCKKVLRTAHSVAKHLEGLDRNYCYMGHMPVRFQNERVTFDKFVQVATGWKEPQDIANDDIVEFE